MFKKQPYYSDGECVLYTNLPKNTLLLVNLGKIYRYYLEIT